MLGAKQLYQNMVKVSQRYEKLKGLFDQFCNLAQSQLTSQQCPVKGILFHPDLQDNQFGVTFAGVSVVFSFSLSQDSQGTVTCIKGAETQVGSFSFSGQGDTNLKTVEEGDVLGIDTEASAGYLVMHFVSEALQK